MSGTIGTRMKGSKLKKIPIISYLCYLLAVSVLFTGVTFSRYTSSTSGDVSAPISGLICSYEIDDISSSTMMNSNFWMYDASGEARPLGVTRTVRYTLRNYLPDEHGANGVGRISDLKLQASLRLHVAAELADRLVLQLASFQDGAAVPVTPQYVVGNLLYEVEEQNGVYEYTGGLRANYANYFRGDTLDTAKFRDYRAEASSPDAVLSMTGGFEADGTGFVSASSQSCGSITVSSQRLVSRYSVGFQRGTSSSDFEYQLFLNLEKEDLYYTIDIAVPQMMFEAGRAGEQTYVLYVSLSDVITGPDFGAQWTDEDAGVSLDDLLSPPAAGSAPKLFNGARVTGYYFDAEAPQYSAPGGARTGSTQIRIERVYDYENGGARTNYYHVAPISEDSTFSYVHPVAAYYNAGGEEIAQPADAAGMQSVYGLCSQLLGADGAARRYIGFADMPDEPFYATYAQQQQADRQYNMYVSLSKSYSTELNALFVQMSETGGGA